MLKPSNPKTTPPGDWKVVAPETGVPFRHHNLTELLSQIRECRRGMGLHNGGDWIERVYEAICQQNADVPCHDKEVKGRVWLAEDVMRFVTTLKEFAAQGKEMVTEDEQLRRIAICKKCPKIGDIACRWCGPLAEMITEFIGSRKLPKLEDVYRRSCLACGCDVTSKSAYPVEVLKEVDAQMAIQPDYWIGDEARPKCWMLE